MTEHDITHMDEMTAMMSRLWGLGAAIRGLTPLDEDIAEAMESALGKFQAQCEAKGKD